jgi:predicted nuclease of predicted toxin-antitoxin system
MTLLFDENLSPQLVSYLAERFPNSSHVEWLGMRGYTDTEIWNRAKRQLLLTSVAHITGKAFVAASEASLLVLNLPKKE